MDIYLFQAFASNNSGSYTIVGTFRDAATAESVAKTLTDVTDAHTAWFKSEWNDDSVSPLDEFAAQFHLHESKPGRSDNWPEYGPPPTVMAADCQVIVYAPYTVSMPALYGEFFYARGGRVQVEVEHAHDDIAVEFMYWGDYNDPEKNSKLDAFEARLQPLLAPLVTRDEHDNRPVIEPAWYRGHWGGRNLAVVFRDLLEGVATFGRLAREMGVNHRLDVRAVEPEGRDPFMHLRPSVIPRGTARILLWQVGERIAAMKAVREALGCGLDAAKQAIADLPAEILVDVDMEYAKKGVDLLVRAGCEAEVVVPVRRDD